MTGRKDDKEKHKWGLLPMRETEEVIEVLMFGAEKYAPDNWKKVPDGEKRYLDAIFRHSAAIAKGEIIDPESGLPHAAHIGCSAMFLSWFQKGKMKEVS
jgi:hypothetical protein